MLKYAQNIMGADDQVIEMQIKSVCVCTMYIAASMAAPRCTLCHPEKGALLRGGVPAICNIHMTRA